MKVSVLFRRFLCALMVCLLLVPAYAAAENVDLASLSDAEIVELMNRVNQEIVNRGISKTAKLSKGEYVAGKDIPVGKYTYTCLATGDDWGNVTIYSKQNKQLMWEVVMAPKKGAEPETIFISLNEGDKLESGVPFSLTIMTGVVFQ